MLAALLFGIACGGNQRVGLPAPTTPTPSPLAALDFRFQPDTLKAQAGRQVTLGLTNEGSVDHNFSISSLEADVDLKPGETINVIFIAPPSGPIEFFCKFHQDQGMRGVISIEP